MSIRPAPRPIGIWLHLKWLAFRCLERLSDLRVNREKNLLPLPRPSTPEPALWVYVSTIGELNAIEPLLRHVVESQPNLRLVLITDRPQYRDSYMARYPDAVLCVSSGHSSDACNLVLHYPPVQLIVAEIPCWPSDAPCRFSFAFVLQARKAGAMCALVNGWLYHYTPPSRMDHLERRWFQRDYLRAFDVLAVQTEVVRQGVMNAGAEASRVSVAGNIKFDAMQRQGWSATQARSPQLLQGLLDSGRPVIVTGCVTNFDEQELVLDAFLKVLAQRPDTLLVLAPRHPERSERMQTLADYLAQRNLRARFRSKIDDMPLDSNIQCLVLDTMGELRDVYAAATAAHVGVDHNVLEPLAFGTPVTVSPGWNPSYPSFPVYSLMLERNAIAEHREVRSLSAMWLELINNPLQRAQRVQETDTSLAQARGAVEKHLSLLEPWLPTTAATNPSSSKT
ncbi:3-deoxy-D-manno-octulosonic acid transferase [Paucibacter sp. KCTC 42545]|uniref:3-deoxy-D-manno-octulosonic acid transferase n=1 Tax=Paucibacter sp. KCTC 42545 TaxID=1768242 RepID=UPI0009EC021B|nr:glycosyltransferase N-terminal domain-containing protein [Paucibacter sp. KCTC 42545]